MCNKIALTLTLSRREREQKAQRGVSLVLVLFLLVVVSLLAAAMAQLNRGGSNAVSLEIQSTRALFAAESGAQIMAMTIFPISLASGSTPLPCPTNFSKTFSSNGLSGCSANMTCSAETAAGPTIYTVTSEGTCGSGNDYARRRITVGLRSL